MKLYEIPRNSKLEIANEDADELTVTFHHIDGMYSYCTVDADQGADAGRIIHLSASTSLYLSNDHYHIAIRKCTRCGDPATRQTLKGKQNQKSNGLSQNDGWFCDACWKKGDDAEKEAMYG